MLAAKHRIVLGDVAHGEDPAEDKQARRDAETFRGLAKSYLEYAEQRHRSWKEAKRIIDKDLLPVFSPRLLVDIRRRDVRELVEAIARRRKAPVMANRTLGVLSRMFNFALDREWIEANPAARIPDPGEEQSRERVLSDDELRELWQRLETIAKQTEAVIDEERDGDDDNLVPQITRATAQAFQVQLLTAQRPGEVRAMKWADVDLGAGWWSIPAAVAKNGRPHRVPLTATAIEIIEARLKNAGEKAIVRLRESPGPGLCRPSRQEGRSHPLQIADVSLPRARLAEDATRMAEAGVSRDHIVRVLNHVEAGPAATRVYDRYDYDAEKREALERWARRLLAIIEGKTRKVVSIGR
jgi:integrase